MPFRSVIISFFLYLFLGHKRHQNTNRTLWTFPEWNYDQTRVVRLMCQVYLETKNMTPLMIRNIWMNAPVFIAFIQQINWRPMPLLMRFINFELAISVGLIMLLFSAAFTLHTHTAAVNLWHPNPGWAVQTGVWVWKEDHVKVFTWLLKICKALSD